MEVFPIPANRLLMRVHDLWDQQWLLLSSGEFSSGEFNSMTVSWGGMGIMWNKPIAIVVVRPTRFTYQFMEQFREFTLCAFDEKYRSALEILGTKSGRDSNKIAESGLTPVQSTAVAAPAFREAELIIECRKIYYDDLNPYHFLKKSIITNYSNQDFHRMYFGEIQAIRGTKKYFDNPG